MFQIKNVTSNKIVPYHNFISTGSLQLEMQTADSPGEDRVLKKIKLKGKIKLKTLKNKLAIAASLILILSSNIFAQGNFTTEWESPGGWEIETLSKLNVNSNVIDLILRNVSNERNIRIYDGSTHQLKSDYEVQGDYTYVDLEGITGLDYSDGDGFFTNMFDVNNDGINELIHPVYISQTLTYYLRIINPLNGLILQEIIRDGPYYVLDLDSDGYLEIVLDAPNNIVKIISTPAHTVSVNNQNEVVKNYELKQNYPNPFNPNTTIEYNLNKSSEVKVIIYDILGKEVSTLVNEKQNPGIYKLNLNGSGLSSGTYFYSLIMDGIKESKKMILLK